MKIIPDYERKIIEKAIYLPMLLTILDRDLTVINNCGFKLKSPYTEWIESTMKVIQTELGEVKRYMKQHDIKVGKMKTEESFTQYFYIYQGHETYHRYFNPRLRNRSEELLRYYLYERFQDRDVR
ncbi:hypothetical protein B4102_2155 [Heyndrickxia sporothermodurans]|uniref:YhjD n=1 Tax=Heyndrickxia sporothermodurans TaxID=46224 RepID=A0A150LGH5_9BACI|nr:hypothetical protein [Heyndrickxia sporothermodurans]KYD11427.1 hypothetical protein B4102_2155 [Heyndrickxia sporothermodurans]